jgi:hypothetical protein
MRRQYVIHREITVLEWRTYYASVLILKLKFSAFLRADGTTCYSDSLLGGTLTSSGDQLGS